MISRWTVAVNRDDIAETALLHDEVPELAEGEALLQVSRVGLTANNVTYGLIADLVGYWKFFPFGSAGVIPVWGFADVVESTVEGLAAGTRVYGYLPMSSHLVVRPQLTSSGFVDVSEHRTSLPGAYNSYSVTSADPAYDAALEDLHVLYRPLFMTSFLLADQLVDNAFYGGTSVVVASASSKTAFGTALRLRSAGVRVIGLTSPGNVDFTAGLGVYSSVLTYDALDSLPVEPSVYLDFSGSADLRTRLHDHLGSSLVKDIAIGLTHQASSADPRAEFFFAPEQLRKRTVDWGAAGFAARFGEAWGEFVATAGQWVDVTAHSGPEELVAVWQELVEGKVSPTKADVFTF